VVRHVMQRCIGIAEYVAERRHTTMLCQCQKLRG
jgi:hypothetical protein